MVYLESNRNLTSYSTDGDGRPVDSMSGVVPIIKEKEKYVLQTIGTGF